MRRYTQSRWDALVVEDDYLIAFDLESRLIEMGAAKVFSVRSADEGERLLGRAKPAIAFVDWRLGRTTARGLVELLAKKGVPACVVTGHLRAHVDLPTDLPVEFLQKPATDEHLSDMVDVLLARAGKL